jgi:hypothetical protein
MWALSSLSIDISGFRTWPVIRSQSGLGHFPLREFSHYFLSVANRPVIRITRGRREMTGEYDGRVFVKRLLFVSTTQRGQIGATCLRCNSVWLQVKNFLDIGELFGLSRAIA